MFRIKVAATLFLVFATIGGVIYFNVASTVEESTRQSIGQRLTVAQRSLGKLRRLSDYGVVAKAQQVANWPPIAEILSRSPESFATEEGTLPDDEEFRYQVHRLMNEEIAAWRGRFEKLAEGEGQGQATADAAELANDRPEVPDYFVILDAGGLGVANAADKAWFGPEYANVQQQFPAVTSVVSRGQTIKDIWMLGGSPMTVGVAPIRRGDRLVGAVAVGYRLTEAEARRDRELVSTEVAYFIGDRLSQSSSLDTATERALQAVHSRDKLVAKRGVAEIQEFELNGRTYLGSVAAVSEYASAPDVGVIALVNFDVAMKEAREVLLMMPVLMLLGYLLCVALVLAFFQRFMQPIVEIDQGIMEIINGDLDYWFDVKGNVFATTMSQNLNIMVCHLSGRPLPEDENAPAAAHWAGEKMFGDELAQGGVSVVDAARVAAGEVEGIPPEVVALILEDDDAYRRRIFREYTEGLRKVGQPVQGITFEAFQEQLNTNERGLREKFACTRVRFLVKVASDRVSLQPVPLT